MTITLEQVKAWMDKNPGDLMHKEFLASEPLQGLMTNWAKKDLQRWSDIVFGESEEQINEAEVEKALWQLYGGDHRRPESYKIYADFFNDNPPAAEALLEALEQLENEERT